MNSCTWLVALWQCVNAKDGACRNRALNVAGPVQGVENHNIFAIVIQMHLRHSCIQRESAEHRASAHETKAVMRLMQQQAADCSCEGMTETCSAVLASQAYRFVILLRCDDGNKACACHCCLEDLILHKEGR